MKRRKRGRRKRLRLLKAGSRQIDTHKPKINIPQPLCSREESSFYVSFLPLFLPSIVHIQHVRGSL